MRRQGYELTRWADDGLREQDVKLVELRVCGIAVGQSRCSFHLTNDRIQGTIGVLRRREVAKAVVRFAF
jgi:hypothetical protein